MITYEGECLRKGALGTNGLTLEREFCVKKWKCDKKKCLNEPFFEITSQGNLKVAINWKIIKITFVKKVMTLLIVLSFEGAALLTL